MQACDAQELMHDCIHSIEILVDLHIYSIIAVKKACYKFTADCSIQIKTDDTNKLRVTFVFPLNTRSEIQNKLIDEFHNELLDQDLRERISKETELVRNLILAEAFSKTRLSE